MGWFTEILIKIGMRHCKLSTNEAIANEVLIKKND